MNIESISAADMTNLTEQGYTAQDLAMLSAQEIQNLTVTIEGDDAESVATDDDTPAAPETSQDAADETATDDTSQFVPQYTAEVPADAKEQIAALRTKEKDAFKQLMEGVIDADEYQTIRDEVESETDDLKTKALKAEIFTQANQQASEQVARNEWQRAETQAMNGFKEDGLDYRAKPALLAAYNTHLKALGADPKNERRDAPWFLAEAHRLTKDDLGFVSKTQKVQQTGAKRVDVQEMPPTLRNVPVAATGSVNADEFAHMRNLSGLALERAHAAMTEAQRDRWMAE